VAVEDSDNGVQAARSAGLPVVAVTNDYTAAQELQGAALVLDGFGRPERPATVRHDPHSVMKGGVLNAAVLDRIAAKPSGAALDHNSVPGPYRLLTVAHSGASGDIPLKRSRKSCSLCAH
jgi:hypothetical protein